MKNHFIYWILPTMVIGLFIYIYFFNPLGLSYLIAPEYNREFGLLENIQLIIIIAIIILSFKKISNSRINSVSLIFSITFFISVLVLLEEIDYGLHYYDYILGKSKQQIESESWNKNLIRNFHNQGNLTFYIKLITYIAFVLLIFSPYLLRKIKINNKYLNQIAPRHYLIYSILSMVFLNRVALYIDKEFKQNDINSLNSNISEFEEVFIYYIVFLYLLEKSTLLLTSSPSNSSVNSTYTRVK